MTLTYRERPAAGEAEGLLILHHGRGADEFDLLPLADLLDRERRLHALTPRAPLQLEGWRGYHWYVVPRVGYPDPETFQVAYQELAAFHDEAWERTGLTAGQTVFGGFSMGSVMSYALGLGADRPAPAGILAFSGFIPVVEGWEPELESRRELPVFVAHGRNDPIMEVGFARRRERRSRRAASTSSTTSPTPRTRSTRTTSRRRGRGSRASFADGMEPLVPPPAQGRTFRASRPIRLSDRDATGRLRLDAIARYLQDVASDDVDETGWGAPDHLWVLRHLRIDVVVPPVRDRLVELTTWSSATGTVAAGRRMSLTGDGGGRVELDSVWVHLGRDARPARIENFDVYAEAAVGRIVSTKLELAEPPADAPRTRWPLRATDVDLLGHVNNAAYWHAVEECLARAGADPLRPFRARLDHRHALDLGEEVELATSSESRGAPTRAVRGRARQGGGRGRADGPVAGHPQRSHF